MIATILRPHSANPLPGAGPIVLPGLSIRNPTTAEIELPSLRMEARFETQSPHKFHVTILLRFGNLCVNLFCVHCAPARVACRSCSGNSLVWPLRNAARLSPFLATLTKKGQGGYTLPLGSTPLNSPVRWRYQFYEPNRRHSSRCRHGHPHG